MCVPAPTVTIIQQPVVTTTVVQLFRESPVQTVCPYCQANIVTAIHYDVGTFAWLIGAAICFFGCSLGCCLIPCCIDGCKDVVHTCPNCNQQISRWNRL
ncbi:hypothetical protein NP493_6446g00002 [Ridgeia piscesae]|uniref:LITAF domain-containing protein n=1 Tax=Ridgeia piscesae TaxID=27915 RepID=A0AAD9IRN0_RIDPI|nr:hypothetical protein NP493_6446g00002 [Ridgeia piscesae]